MKHNPRKDLRSSAPLVSGRQPFSPRRFASAFTCSVWKNGTDLEGMNSGRSQRFLCLSPSGDADDTTGRCVESAIGNSNWSLTSATLPKVWFRRWHACKRGSRHPRRVLPKPFTASPTFRLALPTVSCMLPLLRAAAPSLSMFRLPTACPIFSFRAPFVLLILPLISDLFGTPIAKLSFLI